MAKPIMIADDVYRGLKEAKGRESFSVLIRELMESKKTKTGTNLKAIVGLLKNDGEYDLIMKDLKKRWSKWTKEYA